jgi:hypothetical protein
MLDCLEQAIDLGPRFSLFTLFPKADPLLEPYRDDPRFIALLGRMNLAD